MTTPMSAPSLSDEEIDALWHEHSQNTGPSLRLAGNNISRFARAIEAKVRTLRAGQATEPELPCVSCNFPDGCKRHGACRYEYDRAIRAAGQAWIAAQPKD